MSALSGSTNKNHIYQQDAGQTVYELQEVQEQTIQEEEMDQMTMLLNESQRRSSKITSGNKPIEESGRMVGFDLPDSAVPLKSKAANGIPKA